MKIFNRKLTIGKKYLLLLICALSLVASPSLLALQYAHPDGATTISGSFTFNDVGLWQDVGEGQPPDDATSISTTALSVIEFTLTDTVIDPGVDTAHIIKFRSINVSNNKKDVVLSLYEGTTLVGESTIEVPKKTNSWTEFSYQLPTAVIGTYNNLRIRISAPGTNPAPVNISWVELETPNAAAITAPTVDTPTFADVTDTTATLGGTVSSDGGATITERGTVWGLAADPDIVAQAANVNTVAGTTGAFTGPVSGLPSGTLIHFRAYATNSQGTSYSADTTFTTNTPAVAPTVNTPTFADVTDTTATLGGNVASDGGGAILQRGTVWGLGANPDIVAQSGNVNTVAGTTGIFSGPVAGLPAGTLIHFRAYATNSAGTSYSADSSFTTLTTPTVISPTFASVTTTTALLGGNVTSNGGEALDARGIEWGTNPSGPYPNSVTEGGTAVGVFTVAVSSLPAGTDIYFRAWASNPTTGKGYSGEGSFTTNPVVTPTVTTPSSTSIGITTATLGGTVTSDGGESLDARGIEWGTDLSGPYPNSVTEGGTAVSAFSVAVSSLPAGTTIYFRAWASNPTAGKGYSGEGSFATNPAVAPTVTTPTSAGIGATTATLGGTVTSDGGEPLDARGIEWGTDLSGPYPNSVTEGGTAVSAFSVAVSGLPSGTTIYFRAWASNPTAGKGYSGEGSFTTDSLPPTVTTPTSAGIGATTATLGGTVTSDGGESLDARGIEWGTDLSGPYPNSVTEGGTAVSAFSVAVSGLPAGTTIYFRAWASNPTAGKGYSGEGSFTTDPGAPTVSTPTSNTIGATTATLGGTVVSDGGEPLDARGIEWGTDLSGPYPNSVTEGGTAVSAFSVVVSGLPSGTTIYFRAWASNPTAGKGYSGEGSFTTDPLPPTVTTPTSAGIGATTATLGGTVTSDGGEALDARGIEWGTDLSGPYPNSVTEGGTAVSTFTVAVSSLPSGTTIYFRAWASNPTAGKGYSGEGSFTTDTVLAPTVTTPTSVGIGATTATLGGTVTSDGGESLDARGIEWGTDLSGPYPNSVTEGGTAVSAFTVAVSGLPDGTDIYFRAWASNPTAGKGYSSEGSFTTELGTAPPTVDSSTAANITYFSADLGGTISSDGGAAITERGTVWNTTGTPITEKKLAEGGTTTGTFSHTRINLPRGTTVWYRAYATNTDGTSYSEDASFVTLSEPNIQASNISFSLVSANSMRITWTRGNGEGSIVVLREAATGRTDPGDGNDYTGNPDLALATELPTSSGNFVVYNGTYNAIQVFGLSQETNYTVAVYTYAGSGSGIDYLTPPAELSQLTTDFAVHNTSYARDCTQCHNHGGFSYVPRDDDQQVVCEICHSDSGIANTTILDFGLHGTVDCGSCHELHNPNGATTSTHPLTSTTTTNKLFIRSDVDKYVPTAGTGTVYHTPIADLAIENAANETEARGVCQNCHTGLGNYNHDGSGDQCHDGSTGNCDPITNGGTDCLGCHTHADNFAASGGGCTGCHASTQGGAPPLDRREIVSEFSRLRHHVAGTLADSDCEVCHQQSAADPPTHNHKDGSLTLWDVDNHTTTGGYQLSDHSDPNTDVTEAAKLTDFCLGCHDSETSRPGLGGADAEASPLAPFTGSGAPFDIYATWPTSSHATVSQPVSGGSGQPTTCLGDGNFGCHGTGHGSEKLKLLTPADTIAISPEFTEEEEGFCFGCHDSDGPSQFDIESQFNSGTNYTVLSTAVSSKDPQGEFNQRHDVLWADQDAFGSAIECTNCHLPHKDNSADANIGIVSHPDDGSKLPDYNPANYTGGELPTFDPTNPIGCNPANGTPHVDCETVPGRIEPDYIEFCNACHDGGPYPSGVVMKPLVFNMATAYETDQHGKGQQNQEGKGTLKPPWVTTLGDDYLGGYAALNCTTCHGPHGSVNIYNLRESITVAGVAMEIGGESGSGFDTFSGTTYTLPGTPQEDHKWGAWCTFCHELSGHSSYNEGTSCTKAHQHGDSNF